jgi:hypothetical protein
MLTALLMAIAMTPLSCASSEPKSDFELDVDSHEIRMAISEEVARGVMEEFIGADLDCQGEIDEGLGELLSQLDRGGPRSRATYRDGESTINARRHGGKVSFDITGRGSGKIEATMPWAVAECLLGRSTTVDKSLASGVTVKVSNPEGRNFSFKLQ